MIEKTAAPLKLIKNVRYSTYQLFALSKERKDPPEIVLTIAILETMRWLRERFRDFEIPLELKCPLPEDCADVDLSAFSSFQINEGYKLDVVWIPQKHSWSLQLTEPDLGSRSIVSNEERPPVPGRLIETNIAYRIFSGRVECGFRTVIAEPEGTTAPCEVYRLAVVKYLARNLRVGLRHGNLSLLDEPHIIDSKSALKNAKEWLRDKDRMMPAVISVGMPSSPARDSVEIGASKPATFPATPSEFPLIQGFEAKPVLMQPVPEQAQSESRSEYLLDLTPIARYKMGYAQFFHIPIAHRDAFQNSTGQKLSDGEVMLWEPHAFGNGIIRYPRESIERDAQSVASEIEDFTQNYPKGKDYKFGNVLFARDAKIEEQKLVIAASKSLSESKRAFDEVKREFDRRFHDKKLEYEGIIADLEAKNTQLREERQKQKGEREALVRQHAAVLEKKDRELGQKDSIIDWLKTLPDRPKNPKDVAAWVEKRFPGKLIFHEKATDLMKKLQPGEADILLICDALEFLAIDYRDELLGRIDEDEMRRRCEQKYKRPFEVTPLRGIAIEKWPDYKIKYKRGYTGKPVETRLDLHLCVGNDSEYLLRIYFLYDKEEKLIVVGSLPKHLPT